ncbi:tumor necrosis factor receptor superfamily member 16-like [Mya arenaria]|uniref:tumor necrosis factor receptor superfamily member 16-like n=1 Tax=Mya arenaria TaxID=6604 RepID=UPI0022E565E8|nr:tumor necrosis factor receptor superfamily member 16-like [Mya arenaria]
MKHRFITAVNWIFSFSLQIPAVLPVEPVPFFLSNYKTSTPMCDQGKYYSETPNGGGRCKKCRPCHKGYSIVQHCTETSGSKCEPCPAGTFSDSRNGDCKNCTVCDKGYFVRKPCLPYKDTRCRRCPEGTFSVDGTRWACRYCRICSKRQDEILPCTIKNDRLCTEDFIMATTQSEVIWTEIEVEDNVEFSIHTRLVLVATCTAISFAFLIVLLAWTLQTYHNLEDRYQMTLCKICVL